MCVTALALVVVGCAKNRRRRCRFWFGAAAGSFHSASKKQWALTGSSRRRRRILSTAAAAGTLSLLQLQQAARRDPRRSSRMIGQQCLMTDDAADLCRRCIIAVDPVSGSRYSRQDFHPLQLTTDIVVLLWPSLQASAVCRSQAGSCSAWVGPAAAAVDRHGHIIPGISACLFFRSPCCVPPLHVSVDQQTGFSFCEFAWYGREVSPRCCCS